MGDEDPWLLLVGGPLTLLLVAGVLYIPIRIIVLFMRQRRSRRSD